MHKYEIEHGVPVVASIRDFSPREDSIRSHIVSLEIGQSLWFSDKKIATISSTVSGIVKKKPDRKYRCAAVTKNNVLKSDATEFDQVGVRVWRLS